MRLEKQVPSTWFFGEGLLTSSKGDGFMKCSLNHSDELIRFETWGVQRLFEYSGGLERKLRVQTDPSLYKRYQACRLELTKRCRAPKRGGTFPAYIKHSLTLLARQLTSALTSFSHSRKES